MPSPPYLAPYLRAAEQFGAGFGSLLWASPSTQSARFGAIERLGNVAGRSVLDVGCGRGDFLDFLLRSGIRPADYVGIEAVAPLAEAAEAKAAGLWHKAGVAARIIRADFVAEPMRMFVGADVVAFSGSLNTADDPTFYGTLRRAFDATADVLVFNFLSSTYLAGQQYLYWRRPQDVLAFARGVSSDVRILDDYLKGDCTVAVRRAQ